MSSAIIDTTRSIRVPADGRFGRPAKPAERASAPRLRLTRRGRALLSVVIGVPLVASTWLALGSLDGATATDERATSSFQYVQVEDGQSLWQIASAVAPAADPRDVVSEIVRLNGLTSSDVFPGQRLGIPEQYRG